MKDPYLPPFTPNQKILTLSIKVAELIGRWNGATRPKPKVTLRKLNKIRSIQSSLAIEGNTLTLDQVTAILENKRVLGPKKDILEVQNAIRAYEVIKTLSPLREKDFLKLHDILMKNLIPSPGRYRTGQVGILKGSKVSHVAPPHSRVPKLMDELFFWLKKSDSDSIITSCIFHYEVEFIHPFEDGNGRMGRLWQSLILSKKFPIFEFVPIEEMVKESQKLYYLALEKSDRLGDSAPFVEFMLSCMIAALEETLSPNHFESSTGESRIESAQEFFGKKEFSRADYLKFIGNISSATASRDLKDGVKQKKLILSGDKRTTRYKFFR